MSNRKHFVNKWSTKFYLLTLVGLASLPAIMGMKFSMDDIAPIETPDQLNKNPQYEQLQKIPQFLSLIEAKNLIRSNQARDRFSVTGKGLTVAVIDSGLKVKHNDFIGRVIAQRNFTSGNEDDVSDLHGHGTHVTGIIAADGRSNQGIAPDVKIIPIKVLNKNENENDLQKKNFDKIEKALQWIVENHKKYNITAVCMSLGHEGNYSKEEDVNIPNKNIIKSQIKKLKDNKVAVIAAAGNNFHKFKSKQGMAFPAIIPETISVGAVYDAEVGKQIYNYDNYGSGAIAKKTAPDVITPFSQRLHESVNPQAKTDIFAPGALIVSSGINNNNSKSKLSGTSQATPVVTGVVLLLQEYYLRKTGNLPSIDDLEKYLRDGGIVINDGDDKNHNVVNTGLDFIRIDALSALENMDKDINNQDQ